jgi:hypothetical protein
MFYGFLWFSISLISIGIHSCGHRVYRVPGFLFSRPNWVPPRRLCPPPPTRVLGGSNTPLRGRGWEDPIPMENRPQRPERGGPLLSVETEVNENSKNTNERSSSLMVLWACRAGTRDFCPALAALGGQIKNIFSSPYTISFPLSPSITQQAGQEAVLGRSMCLCDRHCMHILIPPRLLLSSMIYSLTAFG